MQRGTKIALLLSLLSPFLAEVLSGSTPPTEVATQPLAFPMLWLYYGSGVLLAREAWVRWGRGYLRLMLLGAVYGIVEEGLVIRSWFDPNWADLGIFATYGRVWGINTVWAVWLTIFHSLMSIAVPIMLIDTLYPEFRTERLLGPKGIRLVVAAFLTSAAVYAVSLTKYVPPLLQYLLTVLLVVVLILAARELKGELPLRSAFAERHSFIYGLLISALLFFIFTALPHSSVPPAATSLLGLAVALHFYSQPPVLTDKKLYFLNLGFLAFWLVPYDVILELNGVTFIAPLGILTFLVLLKKGKSKE
ncbi:hypothetical protein A3L11_05490 [Thermococcus siculi]|uniref:Uncharacterized protein n=1 Tax=Thermococcus siculi TaxID=72803 RepID=A0A2Z2MXN4_9EURY|nr:hypothetical protein [Thermococcus siculi]ASJ08710.1 hypothetical protein A3L11_05490 [Thermococcus siculi]